MILFVNYLVILSPHLQVPTPIPPLIPIYFLTQLQEHFFSQVISVADYIEKQWGECEFVTEEN